MTTMVLLVIVVAVLCAIWWRRKQRQNFTAKQKALYESARRAAAKSVPVSEPVSSTVWRPVLKVSDAKALEEIVRTFDGVDIDAGYVNGRLPGTSEERWQEETGSAVVHRPVVSSVR